MQAQIKDSAPFARKRHALAAIERRKEREKALTTKNAKHSQAAAQIPRDRDSPTAAGGGASRVTKRERLSSDSKHETPPTLTPAACATTKSVSPERSEERAIKPKEEASVAAPPPRPVGRPRVRSTSTEKTGSGDDAHSSKRHRRSSEKDKRSVNKVCARRGTKIPESYKSTALQGVPQLITDILNKVVQYL